jgi:1,3-propanediol dehydrogenase/alcohol dehydrogenase
VVIEQEIYKREKLGKLFSLEESYAEEKEILELGVIYMNSFHYYLPVKIHFGIGSLGKVGDEAIAMGKRAVIVCGKKSMKENGAIDQLIHLLKEKGVECILWDGIDPEPEVVALNQALLQIKDEKVDIVIGIGGGSTLDLGKALALLAEYPEKAEAYFGSQGVQKLNKPGIPYIAIPTTAGTGSEVTNNSVFINASTGLKQSIASPFMFPKAAVIDPDLTKGVPPKVTAASGMDALTHGIESYLSRGANDITKTLAYKSVKLISRSLKRAYDHPGDMEARADMAEGSLMAGMAFGNSGLGIAHGISHPLGYHFHIPHGVANAMLLPKALKFNREVAKIEIANLYECFFAENKANYSMGLKVDAVISHVEELARQLNIPQSLKNLGVKKAAFEQIALESFSSRSIKYNKREATVQDVKKILEEIY